MEIFNNKQHIKYIIIGVGIIFIGILGFILSENDDGIVISSSNETETIQKLSPSPTVSATPAEEEKIKIYVTGCVKNPGIYEVKKGQILYDVIQTAGGLNSEADKENINMVYEIKENVMIKIKSKKQVQEEKNSNPFPAMQIIKDSGESVSASGNTDGEAAKQGRSGKVNINTATLSELDSLSGIGQKTAQDIISFREKNGPFKTIEDIKKVPGIKDSRFNQIKDSICVEK